MIYRTVVRILVLVLIGCAAAISSCGSRHGNIQLGQADLNGAQVAGPRAVSNYPDGEWSQYGGNSAAQRNSTLTAPLAINAEYGVWASKPQTDGFGGTPVVGYGGATDTGERYLYAVTHGGGLTCFNAYTLDREWEFPQTSVYDIYSTPAIGADGTIYYWGGSLYAINPNGSLKWSYNLPSDGRYYSPVIKTVGVEDWIICTSRGGSTPHLVALRDNGQGSYTVMKDLVPPPDGMTVRYLSSPAVNPQNGYVYCVKYQQATPYCKLVAYDLTLPGVTEPDFIVYQTPWEVMLSDIYLDNMFYHVTFDDAGHVYFATKTTLYGYNANFSSIPGAFWPLAVGGVGYTGEPAVYTDAGETRIAISYFVHRAIGSYVYVFNELGEVQWSSVSLLNNNLYQAELKGSPTFDAEHNLLVNSDKGLFTFEYIDDETWESSFSYLKPDYSPLAFSLMGSPTLSDAWGDLRIQMCANDGHLYSISFDKDIYDYHTWTMWGRDQRNRRSPGFSFTGVHPTIPDEVVVKTSLPVEGELRGSPVGTVWGNHPQVYANDRELGKLYRWILTPYGSLVNDWKYTSPSGTLSTNSYGSPAYLGNDTIVYNSGSLMVCIPDNEDVADWQLARSGHQYSSFSTEYDYRIPALEPGMIEQFIVTTDGMSLYDPVGTLYVMDKLGGRQASCALDGRCVGTPLIVQVDGMYVIYVLTLDDPGNSPNFNIQGFILDYDMLTDTYDLVLALTRDNIAGYSYPLPYPTEYTLHYLNGMVIAVLPTKVQAYDPPTPILYANQNMGAPVWEWLGGVSSITGPGCATFTEQELFIRTNRYGMYSQLIGINTTTGLTTWISDIHADGNWSGADPVIDQDGWVYTATHNNFLIYHPATSTAPVYDSGNIGDICGALMPTMDHIFVPVEDPGTPGYSVMMAFTVEPILAKDL